MTIRYDDLIVDKLLSTEYQKQISFDLKRLSGLNDIEILLGEFERIFASYIGTKHSIALNSGSDALQLSLLALGIKKGDSVIIPNVTYPSVALSILYAGAEPILVDIAKEDLEINVASLRKQIKKNTKAIIAVHMFARNCNLPTILEFAKENDLFVIEDCCQAESSTLEGRRLGSFGDLSCFSFSYYKPLSSCGGGGGMICFNDEKYKRIIDYTRVWKDDDSIAQAGKRFARMYLLDLLSVKVKFRYLKDIIKSRLLIKDIYERQLGKFKAVGVFKDTKGSVSVPQNFVILSRMRDNLEEHLTGKNIIWQRPYSPLHLMKAFSRFAEGPYPGSMAYWEQALHLPLYSFMKKEDGIFVSDVIKQFYLSQQDK